MLVWHTRSGYRSGVRFYNTALGWGARTMVVFRLIGLLFIVAALMALGSDALLSLENGEVTMRSFSELWALIHEGSRDAFTGWAGSGAPEGLKGPIDAVMGFPAWGVLGVIGIVLAGLIALLRRGD